MIYSVKFLDKNTLSFPSHRPKLQYFPQHTASSPATIDKNSMKATEVLQFYMMLRVPQVTDDSYIYRISNWQNTTPKSECLLPDL
jgi:hypothetical protein